MNPEIIVTVLKKVERYVPEAINRSGRQPTVFVLPFAGNGHQAKYVDQLSEVLQKYLGG